MFETLHDQTWSTQSIANALYDQIIIEAERLFGPEIYHLISAQFDDGIGRLVWSERVFFVSAYGFLHGGGQTASYQDQDLEHHQSS